MEKGCKGFGCARTNSRKKILLPRENLLPLWLIGYAKDNERLAMRREELALLRV